MPGNSLSAGQHRLLTRIIIVYAATLATLVGVAFLRAGVPPVGLEGGSLLPEVLALTAVAAVIAAALVKRAVAVPFLAGLAAATLRHFTGVLGFVITTLTGDLVWCISLCVLGLLAMMVDWPKRRQTPL